MAPLKLYLDTRGAGACWEILERHPDAFETWVERHGIPPIGGGLSLSHLLHFQLDEPEVHARTATYLEVMDLVNLRLTGGSPRRPSARCSPASCATTAPSASTTYDDELVAMSGVDADTPAAARSTVDGVVGEVLPSTWRRSWACRRGVAVTSRHERHPGRRLRDRRARRARTAAG